MATVRKPKGRYHHGDLHRALLDAALDLLRRGEDVGLREVARRAGVSHTAPYRHFADKDALLAAVAEEGFLALSAAIRAATDAAGRDPVDRYYAAATAYVCFAVEHPAHYRVMFGARAPEIFENVAPSLREAGHEAFGLLIAMIEEMQAAGVIRAGSPLEIAVALWSLEHGLAMLELDEHVGMLPVSTVDARARLVHRMILEGLAAREAPKKPRKRPPLRR